MDVLARESGDDLVRVHVRGRTRAGLEDVDRELVVELAGGHPVGGAGDALGLVRVEQPELGVRTRGRGLDPAQPAGDRGGNGLARDGEVVHRLARLGAPELIADLALAHGSESSDPSAGSAAASGGARARDPAGGNRNLAEQPPHALRDIRRTGPADVAAPRALPGRRGASVSPVEDPLLTAQEALHFEPLHGLPIGKATLVARASNG